MHNIREKSLLEVLRSPCFKCIQRQIPYSDNLLTPCMIIDHPELMKEAVEKYLPQETHNGAATIVNEFHNYLMEYSKEWKKIPKEIWERDFAGKKAVAQGYFTFTGESPTENIHKRNIQA